MTAQFRAAPAGAEPLVQMRGVRKVFGPVVALDGARLEVREGEVHGLLGGNGAGKTTLMNILFGLYRADAGDVALAGRPVQIRSPRDALACGIGMVHQHFLQVDPFTVTENVVLGLPGQGSRATLAQADDRIRALAARFGLDVDPRSRVADLPVGARQRVEILKALFRRVRVLILDEPTTNLTPQEVDSLFASLRAMVREGISVVFITHKIREARAVCDRISVMRGGRTVATFGREEATEDALVRAMVGAETDVGESLLFGRARGGERTPPSDQVVLRVEGLEVAAGGVPAVRDCTLQVRRGEILGIAGVAGNGQRELVEAIMGVRPRLRGRVWVDGDDLTRATTAQLLARGVSYIPEDRLRDGFLPAASVVHNLILGFHRRPPYGRGLWLDWGAAVAAARRMIDQYQIRTPGLHSPAAALSGGNIQRLMLARAFSHPCRVLVAHNPSRGLDVPSTEFVYARLLDLRRQGAGILLLSEDLDELMLLADRIAVIFRGQIVGVLDRDAFDRHRIGRLMSGVETPG